MSNIGKSGIPDFKSGSIKCFFTVGIVCAIGVGLCFFVAPANLGIMFGLASLIVLLAAFSCGVSPLKRRPVSPPREVPKSPEGSYPRVGSRRWARAQFYNNNISIEELNNFYMTHPENLADPDR